MSRRSRLALASPIKRYTTATGIARTITAAKTPKTIVSAPFPCRHSRAQCDEAAPPPSPCLSTLGVDTARAEMRKHPAQGRRTRWTHGQARVSWVPACGASLPARLPPSGWRSTPATDPSRLSVHWATGSHTEIEAGCQGRLGPAIKRSSTGGRNVAPRHPLTQWARRTSSMPFSGARFGQAVCLCFAGRHWRWLRIHLGRALPGRETGPLKT